MTGLGRSKFRSADVLILFFLIKDAKLLRVKETGSGEKTINRRELKETLDT